MRCISNQTELWYGMVGCGMVWYGMVCILCRNIANTEQNMKIVFKNWLFIFSLFLFQARLGICLVSSHGILLTQVGRLDFSNFETSPLFVWQLNFQTLVTFPNLLCSIRLLLNFQQLCPKLVLVGYPAMMM